LFKANGEEGLHLWEASIVLSRFINKNPELFEGKKVIELGSGCGLVGISCLMFTNCSNLTFSDYQDSVIENLLTNMKENKVNHQHSIYNFDLNLKEVKEKSKDINLIKDVINCIQCFPGRHNVLKLDWREYEKYKLESFDVIIGSELVWNGGCIQELAKLIRNLLSPSGKAYISMPKKRGMTETFINYLNECNMSVEGKLLNDNDLLGIPLENEKDSKKYFEDLNNVNIMLYIVTRNS